MLYYGACYYPEQYPESQRRAKIAEDIENRKELSFNVVRIAEFAWCEMEPEEGICVFSWLDEIVRALGENGIYSGSVSARRSPYLIL